MITQDWQIDLGGLTIGAGTDYDVVSGPQGLIGSPTVRSDDIDRQTDGASSGRDLYSSRPITIPVNVNGGGSVVTLNQRIQTLLTAWRRSSVETPMDVRIPGQPETVLRYYGRTRGVNDSTWTMLAGQQGFELRFTALDPFAYGAPVLSAVDTASPLTVLASTLGDTTTDRAVLTIVAAGGKPVVTNTTTGGTIAFAENVTGTYILDLHDQITTSGGVNRDSRVSASSDWFNLAGGIDNVLTFTNATSIQITHRPAYEVL